MNLTSLILLILLLLNLTLGIYLVHSLVTSTPYYPSSTKNLKQLLADLKINPKDKKFIDLGSGDGRFIIFAAKYGFDAYGVELNPFLTLLTRLRIIIARLKKRAHVLHTDYNKVNFSEYDIAYLFIYSEKLNKVKERMFKEMKQGSIIICYIFGIDGVEPNQVIGRYKIYKVK